MDRTLISWNVPNMITVPLMSFLGFLLVAVIVQLYFKVSGSNGGGATDAATSSGGY